MPKMPPTKAFTGARAINIYPDPIIKNDIIIRGASFCQVDKTKQDIQDTETITDGYHAWHGAIPNLITIDNKSIKSIRRLGELIKNHIEILDISITLDPKACAKKYLIDASVSWFNLDIIKTGKKDNKFNSIPAHKKIQLDLETAINVLNTITETDKK